MELFVDEAVSRTLLPRVDGQVVEAKLGALILTCTLRIKVEPKKYSTFFIKNNTGKATKSIKILSNMSYLPVPDVLFISTKMGASEEKL